MSLFTSHRLGACIRRVSSPLMIASHSGPEIRKIGQNVNAFLNLHENLYLGVFEVGYYDFVFSSVKNKMAG